MTALEITKKRAPEKSRAETVRQRRSSQSRVKPGSNKTKQVPRQAYRTGSIFLPVEPQPVPVTRRPPVTSSKGRQAHPGGLRSHSMQARSSSRMGAFTTTKRASRQTGYDFAFSLGRTAVHAPAFYLPQLGPRWISAGLTLLLSLVLFSMATANTFIVSGAELSGNQRLNAAMVSSAMGLAGQPIFKAIPSQIESNLRTAFPDLASVRVQVGFPNHIYVNVVERTPILVWSEGGNITWIDSNGVSFTPRGNVPGLIPVASTGNPPKMLVDPKQSVYDQPYIDPGMVQAILTLHPSVPAGSPMAYDPTYGMGWQDPHGWSVYFGQNTQDIAMKEKVYQSIVDTITKQGIQPTLISVEYLDAPFYK
jgi:cell division protein FtsQ